MDVDAVCRSSVRLTDSCPTISLLPNTVVPQFIVECRHIDQQQFLCTSLMFMHLFRRLRPASGVVHTSVS
jgi:hypothetical protein